MNVTASLEGLNAAVKDRVAAAVRVPWYAWTSVLATTSILVGGYWDISWHMSIGRDSFWTPAQLTIQFGGVLAGLSSAYLTISTTLRRDSALRPTSIGVWGFRSRRGSACWPHSRGAFAARGVLPLWLPTAGPVPHLRPDQTIRADLDGGLRRPGAMSRIKRRARQFPWRGPGSSVPSATFPRRRRKWRRLRPWRSPRNPDPRR
jgi:hypothetical protein